MKELSAISCQLSAISRQPSAVSHRFLLGRRFDHAYASVLRGEGSAYGQEKMVDGVARFGESWQFGLDDADIEPFLARHGLALIDRKSPTELEKLNFTDADGTLRGRINGTQGIVTAGVGE